MQILLVAVGAALFVFAGFSWGRVVGFEDGRRAADLDTPRRPSWTQTLVLGALGAAAIAGAGLLQQSVPRLPRPGRLEELGGELRSDDSAERLQEGVSVGRARPSPRAREE